MATLRVVGCGLWVVGCGSRCHADAIYGSIILIFGLGGRDVADGLHQQTLIEPVDPFECGVFDRFEALPRASPKQGSPSFDQREALHGAEAIPLSL